MKFLHSSDADFESKFSQLVRRSDNDMSAVMPVVTGIIDEIKKDGDSALFAQISKFDKFNVTSKNDIIIDVKEMEAAYNSLDNALRVALNLAHDRIKSYHERTKPSDWTYKDEHDMNAIPAIVAGVKEIVVCTPAPGGKVNPLLLAAMHLCGIKTAFKIGGASAIAAMAYGTATVPKVDVITGPGNIYVATAKKLVYGDVNIDMIAGPSEIGVIADDSADPRHIAIDLLSQAEHDEIASAFLITPVEAFARAVQRHVEDELKTLKREPIASASMRNKAAIIVAKDLQECFKLMNELAVEHLEIATNDALSYMDEVKHAGAIFFGHFTPEAMGDYLAGPNHTLPTGGSARFYSPLGVENFMKRSSIISVSRKGIMHLGKPCMQLAEAEGLTAHKRSIAVRLED